jgi:hypothetical protein
LRRVVECSRREALEEFRQEDECMSGSRYFGAPWAVSLRIASGLTSVLLVGVLVFGLTTRSQPNVVRLLMVLGPPLGIAAGVLFAIRGYELGGEALYVLRPCWRSRVSLAGLVGVSFRPGALRRSLRTCGNGGFFSFTGWYWNKELGSYRLFGTDPKRAVVLEFERRRVVVTPEEPEVFIRCVKERLGMDAKAR